LTGRVAILIACPLLLLAGCGHSGTTVTTLTAPAAADGVRTLAYQVAGVSFEAPRSWEILSERPPLVTAVRSNSAVVAVWRYPHTRPLPASRRELARARGQLLGILRARRSTVKIIDATITTVAGHRAIAVESVQRIAGEVSRVRSTHVFAFAAEVVVDEYAPPDLFASVDQAVFSPLLRSLAIARPEGGP
jgi:hypothetical protein